MRVVSFIVKINKYASYTAESISIPAREIPVYMIAKSSE